MYTLASVDFRGSFILELYTTAHVTWSDEICILDGDPPQFPGVESIAE